MAVVDGHDRQRRLAEMCGATADVDDQQRPTSGYCSATRRRVVQHCRARQNDTMTSWMMRRRRRWRIQRLLIVSIVFITQWLPLCAVNPAPEYGDDVDLLQQQHQPQQNASSSVRRCYCNLPPCIPTGYMCKSTSGACFARLSLGVASRGNAPLVLYACAEQLLAEIDRRTCLVTADDAGLVSFRRQAPPTTTVLPARPEIDRRKPEVVDRWSETICCATDMCNYYHFRSVGGDRNAPADIDLPADSLDGNRSLFPVTSSLDARHQAYRPMTMSFVLLVVSIGVALLLVAVLYAVLARMRRRRCHDNNDAGRSSIHRRHDIFWPPPPTPVSSTSSKLEPLMMAVPVGGFLNLRCCRPTTVSRDYFYFRRNNDCCCCCHQCRCSGGEDAGNTLCRQYEAFLQSGDAREALTDSIRLQQCVNDVDDCGSASLLAADEMKDNVIGCSTSRCISGSSSGPTTVGQRCWIVPLRDDCGHGRRCCCCRCAYACGTMTSFPVVDVASAVSQRADRMLKADSSMTTTTNNEGVES